ncbi:MAG: TIGR02594 family protein [Acinetobacter sp.]|nr:TIGR02594 family protein [Acinetobacter sp.]
MGWLDEWLDFFIPKTDVNKFITHIDEKEETAVVAPWMPIAMAELGQKEIPGANNNSRIIAYHAATDLKATTDEVPWCSSFCNWAMSQVGIDGTGKANARSWTHWGLPLESPKYGCIVVLKRGNNAMQGHVGFFIHDLPGGRLQLLGGNQGDKVSIATFNKKDVLAYRWPFSLP